MPMQISQWFHPAVFHVSFFVARDKDFHWKNDKIFLVDFDELVVICGVYKHGFSQSVQKFCKFLSVGKLLIFERFKMGHTCVKHQPPQTDPLFRRKFATTVGNVFLFEKQVGRDTCLLQGFFFHWWDFKIVSALMQIFATKNATAANLQGYTHKASYNRLVLPILTR